MLLSKFVVFAGLLGSAAAYDDCKECSDEPSTWMRNNYKKCAGSYQVTKTGKYVQYAQEIYVT